MVDAATRAGASGKVTPRAAPPLRERLAHDFAATYGRDPQRKQLDWLVRFSRWLGRSCHHDGGEFTRSVPQIATGLGLPAGVSIYATRQRYRNQFANTLRYLTDMGYVDARDVLLRSNGAGRGWVLRLSALGVRAVAFGGVGRRDRVGGPDRRSPHRPRRFAPPSGGTSGRDPLRGPSLRSPRDGGGRTRARGGAEPRFGVAALQARCGQEEGGVQTLVAAWRDGAPLWVVLRAGGAALGLPAGLSKRAELQAERSVAQIDRLAGRRGEGVQQLLWRLEEGAEAKDGTVAMEPGTWAVTRPGPARTGLGDRPVSLGYFVTVLRRDARQWKRHERCRRDRYHSRTTAAAPADAPPPGDCAPTEPADVNPSTGAHPARPNHEGGPDACPV